MEEHAQTEFLTAAAPATSASQPPSLQEGRFLAGTLVAGRYRIISLLGAGGMGGFAAVPSQTDQSSPPGEIDAAALSDAVGFDLRQWQQTSPPLTPLYAFDRIAAWRGRHPRLPLDVTVQASAWRGKITEARVVWPRSRAERMPAAQGRNRAATARSLIETVVSLLVFLISGFLAVRNLKRGRGDRRGAWRLALATLFLLAMNWALTAHWTADTDMMTVFGKNAESWITSAGLIWLLYIALEPAVRARWPHSIVTWTRVLAGRWKDPLVAAHVLYGALVGMVICLGMFGMQRLAAAQAQWGGMTAPEVGVSAAYRLAGILLQVRQAMVEGLIAMFVIFCLLVVLRREWLASIAAALVFTSIEGSVWNEGIVTFGFFLAVFTLLAWVLLRLGLVATMAAVLFVNVLFQTPGAQNLTRPWEWAVIAYPARLLSIVAWGFWTASGDRLLVASPDEAGQ